MAADDPSDEALLARARSGEADALSELLQRHGPAVRRQLQINARWNSVLEVDDVMQVTYFEAFHHIRRFDSPARAFPSWLARIARNNLHEAVEWLGRRKRPQPADRLRPPRGQDSVVWLHDLATGAVTPPPGRAARNEMRLLLENEISRLPEAHGRVLRLIYFEEKSIAEVAGDMGRTTGAVYLLRLRALDRLRGALGSGSQFHSH